MKEHGTKSEKITAWQKIIIMLNEKTPLSRIFYYLVKHYKINKEWEDVLSFLSARSHKHFTDQIFDLNKAFKISVNKCECEHPKGFTLMTFRSFYDMNGMCNFCGLKIKQ